MDDRLRWTIAMGLIAVAVAGILSMTVCYVTDHQIPAAIAGVTGVAVGGLAGALVAKNGAKP